MWAELKYIQESLEFFNEYLIVEYWPGLICLHSSEQQSGYKETCNHCGVSSFSLKAIFNVDFKFL